MIRNRTKNLLIGSTTGIPTEVIQRLERVEAKSSVKSLTGSPFVCSKMPCDDYMFGFHCRRRQKRMTKTVLFSFLCRRGFDRQDDDNASDEALFVDELF